MRTDKLSYKVIWLQGWHFYHVQYNFHYVLIFGNGNWANRGSTFSGKNFLITSHYKCPSIWSQRLILLCTEFLFRAIFWIWIKSLLSLHCKRYHWKIQYGGRSCTSCSPSNIFKSSLTFRRGKYVISTCGNLLWALWYCRALFCRLWRTNSSLTTKQNANFRMVRLDSWKDFWRIWQVGRCIFSEDSRGRI